MSSWMCEVAPQLFCAAIVISLNYSRCDAETLRLHLVCVLQLRHGSGDLEPLGRKTKKQKAKKAAL